MENVMKITRKLIVLVMALICVLSINAKAVAATTYTKNLKKGDKLKFTGTAWYTYKTKALAQKANSKNSNGSIKKGETITISGISGNVLKIGNSKYIYYGATASSCFEKVNSSSNTETVTKKTTLKFKEITKTIEMGQSLNMADLLLVTNGNKNDVKWTSSYAKAATIDKNGKITTVGAHKTTITATLNGAKATCKLIVTSPVDKIKVSKVALDKKTVKEMSVGDEIQLTATVTVTPNHSGNRAVKYTSSNPSAVTVDERTGKVKAIKATNKVVTITATSIVDGKKKATFKIGKVTEKVAEIQLKRTEIEVAEGKKGAVEVAKILPTTASNKAVEFTTNDSKIIIVNKKTGAVKGLKCGEATVTVTAKDGSKVKAVCKVKVVAPVKSIELNTKSSNLKIKETLQLNANVVTVDNSKAKITWTSGDKKIATVSSSGKVTAKKAGTTTITAKAGDKTAICNITVVEAYTYTFAKSTFYTAVPKAKIDSVIADINSSNRKNKLAQTYYGSGNGLRAEGGRCYYVANCHKDMLKGVITNATYNDAYNHVCSGANRINYNFKTIQKNIDSGNPVVLHVQNKTNQHWVTVVGYKGNGSNGINDLLILGSYSGHLLVGSNSGETVYGLHSDKKMEVN